MITDFEEVVNYTVWEMTVVQESCIIVTSVELQNYIIIKIIISAITVQYCNFIKVLSKWRIAFQKFEL